MTTYNTGNPLGSSAAKDLFDNAQNLDIAVNSQELTWLDRGPSGIARTRKTYAGIEFDARTVIDSIGLIYTVPLLYAAGIVITLPNQIFNKDGEYYKIAPSVTLPYTTTGDWVTEQVNFRSVGDAALRSDLSSPAIGAALVAKARQVVANVAALKALITTSPSKSAQTNGFYTVNDGGAADYEAQPPGSLLVADEHSIIAADDGGFWVLTHKGVVSVLQFGAKVDGVTNDTASVQAAIDALPLNGGTITFPGGRCKLTTIRLGNGDGASVTSTRNGIKLIGQGAGFAVGGANVPTILSWAGASSSASLISLSGQISDCTVKGFFLECNALCSGIDATSFSGCTFDQIKIVNPKNVGLNILGGGAPTGNYNVFNKFGQINIALFQPSSIGLYIDGNYAQQNDTWITDFELVRIEVVAGALNAVCAWFKFVDSITFRRCHFDSGPEPTATSCVFDAQNNHGFPAGMAFYDCSINRTQVFEDATHKIRKNYFYGFGTYDLETIPSHNLLCGITDVGEVFGDFLYNEAWLSHTPVITASTGTITAAAGAMRYRRIGKQVFFTCDLFITTNGTGATAVRVTLPPNPGNVSSKNFYALGRNTTAGGGLLVTIAANSQTAFVRKMDDSYPGADSTTLEFSGMYEIA